MFLVPPEVAALAECGDSTSTRYALNGVLCEEQPYDSENKQYKTRFVATDGRCLAILDAVTENPADFPLPEGFNPKKNGPTSGVISHTDVHRLVKSLPKERVRRIKPVLGYAAVQFSDEDETTKLARCAQTATNDLATGTVQQVRCPEGRFPRYRDVMPSSDPVATVMLSIWQLKKLLHAAEQVGPYVTVDLFTNDGSQMVRLNTKAENQDREFTGLLMPVVVDR